MVIFRLFQYQKSEKKDLSSHNLASLCSSLCNKSPKSWFSLPHPHILDFTILLIGLFIVGPGRFISGARYDDLFEGRETFNIEFLSTTGLSLSPTTFDPFNTDKRRVWGGRAPRRPQKSSITLAMPKIAEGEEDKKFVWEIELQPAA